jgi:two-component system sensor histidine kinase/response regulator
MGTDAIRVLLIDDDEGDFVLTRDTLQDIDGVKYELDWVADTAAAQQKLKSSSYDACLVDYYLGETTGLEFLKDVIAQYPYLPFILLTGIDDREIDLQAMEHGVSNFLTKDELKPVPLERAIRYAVERSRHIRELHQYAVELEAKNRELDAYTHTIAHSLRSPLSLFTVYGGTLRMTEGKNLSSDSLEMLDEMEAHAVKLSNLVSQLLLLAQVRDTSEVVKPLNMNRVVKSAIARYDHLLRDSKVQIVVESDLLPTMGHAVWMEEVVANLISNAMKYIGDKNDAPTITIRSYQEDDYAVFEVSDNGIGIAPHDQKTLFEMFSRVRTEYTDKVQGSGLGLSIVQRLILKMNGRVGVRSQPGEGSTFWFAAPMPSEDEFVM